MKIEDMICSSSCLDLANMGCCKTYIDYFMAIFHVFLLVTEGFCLFDLPIICQIFFLSEKQKMCYYPIIAIFQ